MKHILLLLDLLFCFLIIPAYGFSIPRLEDADFPSPPAQVNYGRMSQDGASPTWNGIPSYVLEPTKRSNLAANQRYRSPSLLRSANAIGQSDGCPPSYFKHPILRRCVKLRG